MHLSSLALGTLLSTATSFTARPILSSSANREAFRGQRLQSMQGFSDVGMDDGNSALFGAEVPGIPADNAPKFDVSNHDEQNPMGGELFRKMMEQAKNKQGQGSAYPQGAGVGEPQPLQNVPSPGGFPPAASAAAAQPDQSWQANQMAIYQQQLQVWQQQMAAYAQFSAANPQAAAQMTMPPPPTPPTFNNPAESVSANPQPVTSAPAPVYAPPPQPATPQNMENLDPRDFLPKGSGNKDAYEITNPADVYLAQLKRDSYVRTEARKRGDLDTANRPFEDIGVKAIGEILSPELLESRRKQIAENGGEFETSRDEMIIPYAEEEDTMESNYTGVSYKQKLMEMKQKRQGATPAPNAAASVPAPVPFTVPSPAPVTVVPAPSPAPVVVKEEKPNFALPVTDEKEMAPIPAPSMEDSEETRRSIRNLMGLILKQRGGPGFGAGRLKEADAKRLETSAQEIIAILKAESGMEAGAPKPSETVTAHIAEKSQAPSVPLPDRGGRKPSALTGAIACVDAAVSMYLNAEPSSQKDLLIPVRDALSSALETMNEAIGKDSHKTVEGAYSQPQEPVYATTMNFPDTYQVTKPDPDPVDSKVSAETRDMIDRNTATLKGVYETLKSVAGDEKYGLRDVRSDEVAHIKDVLSDMRSVLMDELENGIPS